MYRIPSKRSTVFILVLALLVGCLAPLAFERPVSAAEGELNWVDARGPGNGDAMALVSDNVHGIIYRATVGSAGNTEFGKGVWKYQAGTWTSLGGEVASLGINTLAYDSVGDRLYAGSNGQGIWCYNPSDGTWTETNYLMRAYDVTALAFGGGKLYAGLWDRAAAFGTNGKGVWCYDPKDPTGVYTDTGGSVATWRILSLTWDGDRLYAGPSDRSSGETYKGVWYYDPASHDTDKWTDTGGGMANRRASAMAYDGTNDLLYSSAGLTGVYYYDPDSPDADNWTYTGGSVGSFEVTSLAYGEDRIYAGCISTMGEGNKGVWSYNRSTNTWTDTGGGLNAYEMKSLAFDTYHHHLFAGTTQDGVWRYNLANNPPTWSNTGGGVSTSYVNCLAYDSTSRLLYVGTDSDGVWCFDPTTSIWTDIGGGVSSFETICLAFGGGKLYAGCYDHNTPAYVGVWCYDPASPDADKWTDTGGTVEAINQLVFDEGSGMLYAGTGEKYTDGGGQGVWRYDPDADTDKWSDISGIDINAYKIDSLAVGGDIIFAGMCDDATDSHLGVWQYDLTNPSAGWTNTGGSVSTYEISSLAWDGGKLYAGCWDWAQYPNVGEGVWCYDPTIPAPDKWSSTGGNLSSSIIYALAWDGSKLYASCFYDFTGTFDGVWYYDPASPDTNKWFDTHGSLERYYVSSLVYDETFHRLYAGTGGEGVWYYGAPPVISSLGTATGGVGSEVTINGSFFGPGGTVSEYVTFGGVPAAVKPGTWTDGSVVCYVPAGVSGTVPVTAYNLNGSSNQVDFTVVPTPTVTSASPASATIGTLVTIDGNAFGATRGTSHVKFGGTKATYYESWTDNQIVCKVPAGVAGPLNISVTTAGGQSNLVAFKVLPRVVKLVPKAGVVGTVVTIEGSGFGATRGTSYVSFGQVKATNYVSWSTTQIQVKVTPGLYGLRNLSVTTAGGKSNLMPFKVTPRITELSPEVGPVDTVVTIEGNGFGPTRGTSTVEFGITPVTSYVSWSNTEIVCRVPATGLGTKPVKVTTTGGLSEGVDFTVQ